MNNDDNIEHLKPRSRGRVGSVTDHRSDMRKGAGRYSRRTPNEATMSFAHEWAPRHQQSTDEWIKAPFDPEKARLRAGDDL